MAEGPRLTKIGTANGVDINHDAKTLGSDVAVKIRLTGNYARSRPPHWPTAPEFTGAPAASLDFPRTILSGVTMKVLSPEANALIAAGAAVLA